MLQYRAIPNYITVLRVILVAPIAYCLVSQQYKAALLLVFIAGLSDGLDGFLARRFEWTSRFGAIVDPLADKLLLVMSYIVLAVTGQIPIWLAIVVLGRDLVIVLGAIAYRAFAGPYRYRPTIWGKLSTASQILFVLLVLLHLTYLPLSNWFMQLSIWCVAAAALASGLHYAVTWGIKFKRTRSKLN